ncbi:MAG: hypothetical protein KH006_02530, partial [Firmicutes bacterium]|nr:hypothetical protein [Bacillota bacterium]
QKTLCAERSVAGWPTASQGAERSENFSCKKGLPFLQEQNRKPRHAAGLPVLFDKERENHTRKWFLCMLL